MSDAGTKEHRVVVGVDTHADTHHVAIVTEYGKPLADREFPTTATGYREVLHFITAFGEVLQVGMEGTGTYGAALTKVLQSAGMLVMRWIGRIVSSADSRPKPIPWTPTVLLSP
jgi:transposase